MSCPRSIFAISNSNFDCRRRIFSASFRIVGWLITTRSANALCQPSTELFESNTAAMIRSYIFHNFWSKRGFFRPAPKHVQRTKIIFQEWQKLPILLGLLIQVFSKQSSRSSASSSNWAATKSNAAGTSTTGTKARAVNFFKFKRKHSSSVYLIANPLLWTCHHIACEKWKTHPVRKYFCLLFFNQQGRIYLFVTR